MLAEAAQGVRHPEDMERLLDFWCHQAQAVTARRPASAIYSIGAPMGVDSSDSFYSFLTYMDALQRQVVDDRRQAHGDGPGGAQGPDRAVKDYAHTIEPLTPLAVKLERIRHNVASPTTIYDVTRHDARSSTPTKAHAGAARRGEEELRRADRHPPASRRSRRQADAVPLGGEGRRDLRERERNKKRAKEFVQFFMQDENLIPYVEGSLAAGTRSRNR